MNTANLPALITAIAGLIAAITALIGIWRHRTGPQHTTRAGTSDSKNTGGTN